MANLVNFANRSRSLRAEYKEANRNLIALKEKYGSLQDIDPSFIDSLEIEVDLLRALDREADFLRDPSTSFDVLKGKLKKINSKLKELCENNQISQLPSLDQDIQWDKVILILSRLQAYERLEQAYRSSVNYIDNMVKPLFKEHINSMKNFLSDDKRLLGDIEKSLQTLTLHLQVVEGSKAKEDRGVIAKIFGGEKPKAGHDVHIDPHVLDSSRQSVDQVLRSLGAMCSNLEMTTSSYTDGFDGIQERYEKIVKELGGCKKEWLTISKKYNFDPNSNLKSMLNLINNLSQISSLYSKKLDVKQTLSLYSNRLRRLERKICDWRSLTGSQKSNDLSQVPILINEIRNMIQYKEKKEAQLRKAQKVKAKVDFCRGLKSSYEASIRSCQSKWSSNFSLLDLDPIEIGSKNWEKFFLLVDQAKACSELLKMNSSHLKNEEIVSTQNLIAPLNILKILGTESEARFEFLRQLEFLSPHSNVLILLEDKKLAEMLSKMDVGTSLPLKARNSKSINNSSNNKKSAGEPVMSERARTALELFKGRVADVSD